MKIENKYDSVSYSLGLLYATSLNAQGIKNINLEACMQGMKDMLNGTQTAITTEEAQRMIQDYMQNTHDLLAESNLNEGAEFLDKNKDKKGVVVMPSGLQYKVLVVGKGKAPKITSKVKAHYKGMMLDGTVFDQTKKNQPATFPVSSLIKGWQEALMLMRTGSKWILFIPPYLAYGQKGAGDVIGPNATLVFELELLEVVE